MDNVTIAVAYHEAGHAVAMVVLGYPVDRVAIWAADGGDAETHGDARPASRGLHAYRPDEEAVIDLAGLGVDYHLLRLSGVSAARLDRFEKRCISGRWKAREDAHRARQRLLGVATTQYGAARLRAWVMQQRRLFRRRGYGEYHPSPETLQWKRDQLRREFWAGLRAGDARALRYLHDATRAAWRRALRLVTSRRRWAAVKAVAVALLARRTLSGEEVTKIVTQAMRATSRRR